MAFSESDIVKLASGVLAAGVIDSNTDASWYEKRLANSFIIDPDTIWTDMSSLKTLPASTVSEAIENAVNNPDLISMVGINEDGTYDDDTAIRLTPVAGTNYRTYVCYNTYNDTTSGRITNFIHPQSIPQDGGAASSAYQATIWIGAPSEGNVLSTSAGNDGDYVSYFWNASGGILLIAPDDAPPSDTISDTDLYLTGFLYAGDVGGGESTSSTGDTVTLESDSDDYWRLKIDDDGTNVKLDRYETSDGSDYDWVTYFNLGEKLKAKSVVLDYNGSLAFDTNNNVGEEDTPSYINAARLSIGKDVILSDREVTTRIETATDIYRDYTILDNTEYVLRDSTESTTTLESGATTLGWVSSLDISDGVVPYIRVTDVEFNTASLSDEDGVPYRLAIYTYPELILLQENITMGGLYAGETNTCSFTLGETYSDLGSYIVCSQAEEYYFEITIKDTDSVELYTSTETFIDSADGESKTQTVPWINITCSQLTYSPIIDGSNIKDNVRTYTNTHIENGVSSYIQDVEEGTVQGPWNLVTVAQHDDTRNTFVGNFYDKTYINSGSGGLWSLNETSSSTTELWSETDRDQVTSAETSDNYIETTTLSFNLYGLFDTEMDDNDTEVVNLYGIMPLIEWLDEDSNLTNRYRITINTNSGSGFEVFESQTYYSFLDGDTPDGEFDYTISPHTDGAEYEDLQIPTRSFVVNKTTARTINIEFEYAVKVYGYYEDEDNPSDDTFTPSCKGKVILCTEEEILYGTALEDKINGVVGDSEWTEASENNYSTLHDDTSLEWLSDFDEEPILFFDTESSYEDTDRHQYLYSCGREACFNTILEDDDTTPDLVVHIPYPDNVNSFTVVLLGSNSTDQAYKPSLYINTYDGANNILINDLTVSGSRSWLIIFNKDRMGNYRYRTVSYDYDEADYNVDNVTSDEIPTDEDSPL